MAKIKIIDVPPGFAPEEIRKQWLDIEIPITVNPIPAGQEVARIGTGNSGGYQVKGVDAVKALREAGKSEAADFWQSYSSGNFVFKKEVCKVIE